MRVQIEVDLTCNKITDDDKLPFEEGRDEVYFLVASAAGGAQTSARIPAGEPGYIGFRGDEAAAHLHFPLWSGGVDGTPVKVGIVVMEQDNDFLGESAAKALEALLGTLTSATGTVGVIASALAPIVKGIIRLFANKHDVVGSISLTMKEDSAGSLSVEYAAVNSTDAGEGTTALVGNPSPTEGKFKFRGGNSDYEAVFRVF